MKRIAVTWEETAIYEAVIEVPDDYPETLEAYEGAPPADNTNDDDEGDWWTRVEQQAPDWVTNGCVSVRDRELTNIERAK